jgi:MYXO-CTERM domain-containing protein
MKRATVLGSFGLAPALTAVTLGLSALIAPGVALGSQSFPGAIMEHLTKTGDAPVCPPTCTLCHTSPAGGVATVRAYGFTDNLRGQSSVAWNARNRMPPGPLMAGDASTVGPAIDALEKLDCAAAPGKPCDSDGDKIPDVAELRAGSNPDGPGELAECPQYGCGASVAPIAARPRELPGAWLMAALGVLVLARRRHPRSG